MNSIILRSLLVIAIFVSCLHGQDKPDARQHLDPVYEQLNPERISTGILHNKVISFAPLRLYDGRQQAEPLSAEAWRQIYHELKNAAVRDINLAPVSEIRHKTSQLLRQSIIPLAILNKTYNTMRPDAVERGAIDQTGRRFSDGVNVHLAAYQEKRVFAVSPLKSQLFGRQQTFRLLDFSGNQAVQVLELAVDFSDGAGFRKIRPDETIKVVFPTAGRFVITTRLSDGASSLLSSAEIEIREHSPLKTGSTVPDIIRENQMATIPYLGKAAGYDAYVFLGDGNREITRPVLVVEGFDLENNIGWQEIFDRLSVENVAPQLIADGYDLVIMNFADATDYIQRNAFALSHLIEWVKEEKPSTEPIIIAGVSMGGLVARYALSWMEDQDLQHDTQLLLSFDAPQQGANIPLGLQYWVWFFSAYNEKADLYREIVNSPGAKQMLVTHYNFFPNTSTLRSDLFAELSALGEYPDHWMLRKVAMASGSGAGIDGRQIGNSGSFMNPGSRLIEWRHRSFLVDVDGDVWAVPDISPQQQIFEGLVNILGPQNEEIDIFVSGTTSYDNAPGGWSNTNQQIADEEPEIEVLGQNVKLGDIQTSFPNHGFIYFASALDLRDTNGEPLDVFYDAEDDPELLSKSPFDSLYFPSGTTNQSHLMIDVANASFLLNQINYLPTQLTIESDTITVPQPTVKARQLLQTVGDVQVSEGADIAFASGNSILLKPGFSVEPGALFRATADASLGGKAQVRKSIVRKSAVSTLTKAAAPLAKIDAVVSEAPSQFTLRQNYPNPFNPQTTIEFDLPVASEVTLQIYDILGRHVKTHNRASLPMGTHEFVWDATDEAGQAVVSGVYFYLLRAGNFVETRKMMLMR